jgi:hypothetical protein
VARTDDRGCESLFDLHGDAPNGDAIRIADLHNVRFSF